MLLKPVGCGSLASRITQEKSNATQQKMKFEWDTKKEQTNINKHGVSFEQASYVFADPYALSKYDNDHSTKEDRWLILGKSINEVILVVVHTFKDQKGMEMVRIISARKATKPERNTYQSRCPK